MREDPDAAVVEFRRRLAARHVAVAPSRSTVAARALRTLSDRSRDQMYWALRASLVARPEDIPTFDSEFALFWRDAALPGTDDALLNEAPSGPRERLPGTGAGEPAGGPEAATPPAVAAGEESDEDTAGATTGVVASAEERLAALDFAEYSADDLLRARRVVRELACGLPRRRSRRLEPSRRSARRLDVRGTLRTAMRTDAELLQRSWLAPGTAARRLVLLVDVSGSMQGYALPLLLFCQAAIRHVGSAEALTFGTRLTRVTPHLRRGSAAAALERATRTVPDWAGGTRIGESLETFNRTWGRRGMATGALVVIASDGWERGDTRLLATELSRLHRASHALIWINPVAGDPDYQPLVRGIAAALEHVDGFQAANNLRSLEELVGRLRTLERARHPWPGEANRIRSARPRAGKGTPHG